MLEIAIRLVAAVALKFSHAGVQATNDNITM
jgi:hypothetical protein